MVRTGYHGTCLKFKDDIVANGLDPSKCKYRKDHWLGQGVYFFEDYNKAEWWAENTSSNNGKCGKVVFKSVIDATDNEILNLDDDLQLDRFISEVIDSLDDIKQLCNGSMPIFDDRSFRAVFFDYYKKKHGISVIIGTFEKDYAGYTKHRTRRELDIQNKIMNITGIRFHERQICVSNKECIKSTIIVYNEAEEVI